MEWTVISSVFHTFLFRNYLKLPLSRGTIGHRHLQTCKFQDFQLSHEFGHYRALTSLISWDFVIAETWE
jgi:hypothetical protein